MDKCLEKYNLPNLNEEAESLNRPITADGNEAVIKKNLPAHKSLDQIATQNFTKCFSKSSPLSFTDYSKKSKKMEDPNYFYEASIIIIPKPDKDITKKENFRPISLMNIDANILNKILANHIQQHI